MNGERDITVVSKVTGTYKKAHIESPVKSNEKKKNTWFVDFAPK